MLELSAASASIAQKGKGGSYLAECYRFESCWGLWDVTGALQSQAAANEVIKPSSSANGGLRDGSRGIESKLNGQRSNPFPKPPLILHRICGFGANPPEISEHRAYLRGCRPRTAANIQVARVPRLIQQGGGAEISD
jgi:hypothetical protein